MNSTNTTTGRRPSKRPRHRTCGDKTGTMAGVSRHRRKGERTCFRCYRAQHQSDVERRGTKAPPLTRWQRWRHRRRHHRRATKSSDYLAGYNAGLGAGKRSRT